MVNLKLKSRNLKHRKRKNKRPKWSKSTEISKTHKSLRAGRRPPPPPDQRASSQHRCAGRVFPETQKWLEGDFPTGMEETSAREKNEGHLYLRHPG